jgi:hypothetical protein
MKQSGFGQPARPPGAPAAESPAEPHRAGSGGRICVGRSLLNPEPNRTKKGRFQAKNSISPNKNGRL